MMIMSDSSDDEKEVDFGEQSESGDDGDSFGGSENVRNSHFIMPTA
jgi:hypothetical protein